MNKRIILLITLFSYLQVYSSYKDTSKEGQRDASTTYGSNRRVGRLPHPVSHLTDGMPQRVLVESRGASPSGKRTYSNGTDSTLMSRCLCNSGFLAQMRQKKSD